MLFTGVISLLIFIFHLIARSGVVGLSGRPPRRDMAWVGPPQPQRCATLGHALRRPDFGARC